ncbi:HD domain-containing protein [Aquimarina sp. ERC-38]|uniref:HD domain-containing protein n=1 Tax=Aquimarina sp. ERC-38 TaxID=2949996 RepID=UPI0022486056|nr:HD domain-containing protein [Aquimarina sp. ERC-38]UZO79501.1 HD domain-containing protein [Aquimarina sp. ERC-38]
MKRRNKLKILNDPIYGFITIPNELIFDLIEHPYFQRLRRISQMGLSYLVYPGAHHTRFHHALGGMYLMQNTVRILRFKGVSITEEEENALYIAILLHDIGHGPFSHAMEHSIVEKVAHEEISLLFMQEMNLEFNGSLTLAIEIFKGTYTRTFLHQLISGQLDMDRMDYLKRDSFYTGVAEGNVNSERLITMLNVKDEKLVVEEKGIYSVEKFLLSRRLMYWQVYLHKTSLVAENLLIRVLKRAKELVESGTNLRCSDSLLFFLKNKIELKGFTEQVLYKFSLLDDYDIVSAMKNWMHEEDFVLSKLCAMLINRDLLKVKIKDKAFSIAKLEKHNLKFRNKYHISTYEASYFVFGGSVVNQAYYQDRENIHILRKTGKIIDIVQATDQFNLRALSKPVIKHFICYPKNED